MNNAYIAVVAVPSSHFVRDAFRGIVEYTRSLSGRFDVVLQDRTAWRERKPAGIIALIHNREEQKKLRAGRLPVVNLGEQIPGITFPTVMTDAREIGRLAALHLLDAGFCRFAYCGERGILFQQRRSLSFVQMLQSKGKACECYFSVSRPSRRQQLIEKKRLTQWVARLPVPVGILCGSDWAASRIYDACKEMRVNIPCDVGLVGVDNDDFLCETYTPPLSSVDTQARKVGYEAAALLFRLLDGKPAPSQPVLIPPLGLIQRQSSDVFISNDPHVSTVVRYIRQHIEVPLEVAMLLKLVPLSRRVLERRFYQRLGWSMRAEIHRCKIERIKQLLIGSRLSIEKIASQTGFPSPSHMSSLFRKKAGLTLRDYRARSRH